MKLTPKRQKAISALLEQPTIQKAADQAGVGVTTLYRWLGDSEFSAAYRGAKKKIVDHTISRIQHASGKAVDVLIEIMDDAGKPPSTRVSAARTILEMTHKLTEVEELQARIDAIEEVLSKQDKHR